MILVQIKDTKTSWTCRVLFLKALCMSLFHMQVRTAPRCSQWGWGATYSSLSPLIAHWGASYFVIKLLCLEMMYSWLQKRLWWTMRLPFLGWWVHGKQKEGCLSKGTKSVSGEKEVAQSRKKKGCTICWCKRLSKKPQEAAGYGRCPGAYACIINPDNHKWQRGSVNWNHLTERGGTQTNPFTGSVKGS